MGQAPPGAAPVALGPRRGSTPAGDPEVRGRYRVALVTMPWVSARAPSIQLGLLATLARDRGFPVDVVHANVDLAARIGVDRFEQIGETRSELYGEWLFSIEAFGEEAPDPDGSRALAGELPDGESADRLLELRDRAIPEYLDALIDERDWGAYDLIGFTTTFQQNVASLAMARRLKDRHPELVVVFGGANVDDTMGVELVRAFPQVDLAIRGEAERAFPMLLDALAHGHDPSGVPGLIRRLDDATTVANDGETVEDLDGLPLPDYDEYFERATGLGLIGSSRRGIELPVETARGCWWGAKKHCTFCGLNGSTIAFRSKSPDRALGELLSLSRRYDVTAFAPVDNIMDRRYLDELFPQLEALDLDLDFFYEVKADLSVDELRDLARWRLRRIQPGIESLHTRTLALMGKGVRAATNVNLLRWCAHLGIEAGWNLLWGFPGEQREHVGEQARLLADLQHLPPPAGGGRIWMERFSPLFRTGSFVRREPTAGYRHTYPARVDLDQLAYFFDYELADTLDDDAYAPLGEALTAWRDRWAEGPAPSLTVVRGVNRSYVDDRRDGRQGTYTLEGRTARLYDAIMTRPVSTDELRTRFGHDVDETLDRFLDAGLIMRDGNLHLALALPAP